MHDPKYEHTREKLIEFKKELETRQNKSNDEESGSGGFGGFGGTAQVKKIDTKHVEKRSTNFDGLKKLWHNKETMSSLMKQSAQAKEIRLHYEQKQLIKSIEEKIQLFDAELKVLRHDKARISIYMKKADLRHVTIFEEFLLLKDFEKTENELEQKLSMKKDEHIEMQSKLAETQSKLDLKKKDIEKLDEGLKHLYQNQDGLIKRGKIVENGLRQAQQELENFQKEKQKKINDLDIVVIMRLAKIQFLNKGRFPSDLSQALAFDANNLDRLQTRIKELEVEKAAEKKLFKNLKERHVELIRDKKKMDQYVGRLDELCNKMMMDKYGKIVDLEKIELIAVNQQIEELKQRMAENEFEHERVMREWLDKINSEKDESIELLKANTTRINEMVELLTDSKKLESVLDNKQRSLGQEMTSTSKKEIEERRRLHTLVQLQAQEIEALKTEISILSRKGGHILPPTQPSALTQS
ncbi:cilia- and flagella-associated 44-like [Brachionus plicatilis]|uniref:Cilia-and flagella-associated 44-like n=1 Tax=Brachionus plicatilis TaxID=10195 RepID=A0A3M7T5N0_BRAPC|nr:cilia- and flagella-associated 44-like [Brachionus plicatilis]